MTSSIERPGPAVAVGPRAALEEEIVASRVVAILRLRDQSRAVDLCRALADGGITVMEITMGHPEALKSLERARQVLGPEVFLGAGTVTDTATVSQVAAAGASFCVAPNLDAEVVMAAQDLGLLPIPGVLSPTEVVAAKRLGLRLLKLFPAGPVGTGYLQALKGPLPDVAFIAVGGVEIEDVPEWLSAGAVAVGLGSGLVGRGGDLTGLAERTERLSRLLQETK
jgi:2-dehydro-3-deoxyphosphogluconate aldolase/(4S)-4-hydroxy-2-oxoglutarate aldolase